MQDMYQKPDKEKLLFFLKKLSIVLFTWIFIYGGTNWISSQRHDLYAFYFPWELKIPLIPEMIFIYLSVYIVPIVHLFLLTKEEMSEGTKTLVFSIIISGVLFLLIPTKIGYPWPPPTDRYPFFFGLVKTLDLPHNLFPSLHITLAYIFSRLLMRSGQNVLNFLCCLWFVSVCFSIILVYQHHIVDILGGLLVGQLSWHLFYFKRPKFRFWKQVSAEQEEHS